MKPSPPSQDSATPDPLPEIQATPVPLLYDQAAHLVHSLGRGSAPLRLLVTELFAAALDGHLRLLLPPRIPAASLQDQISRRFQDAAGEVPGEHLNGQNDAFFINPQESLAAFPEICGPAGSVTPLILHQDCLYLHRFHHLEQTFLQQLNARLQM